MNWLALPTLLLGFVAFAVSLRWARAVSKQQVIVGWVVAFVLALPGILYVAYYSKLLGEPIWLYRLRALPGSELLAALAGLLAGWIQARIVPRLTLSGIGKRFGVPFLLSFCLLIPYMKPVLRPLAGSQLQDRWDGRACLQSTFSTCGPASAATLLRLLGKPATESELARESFSCASGTENWYLARALRRRGVQVDFSQTEVSHAPFPSIAGVKLPDLGNAGHFIALLKQEGDRVVIADPMSGETTATWDELRSRYHFTGFFMSLAISGK